MIQLRLFNEEEKLRQLQERYCRLNDLFWKTRDKRIKEDLRKALIQVSRDFCIDLGMWDQKDEECYQKARRSLNAISKSRSINGSHRP